MEYKIGEMPMRLNQRPPQHFVGPTFVLSSCILRGIISGDGKTLEMKWTFKVCSNFLRRVNVSWAVKIRLVGR